MRSSAGLGRESAGRSSGGVLRRRARALSGLAATSSRSSAAFDASEPRDAMHSARSVSRLASAGAASKRLRSATGCLVNGVRTRDVSKLRLGAQLCNSPASELRSRVRAPCVETGARASISSTSGTARWKAAEPSRRRAAAAHSAHTHLAAGSSSEMNLRKCACANVRVHVHVHVRVHVHVHVHVHVRVHVHVHVHVQVTFACACCT